METSQGFQRARLVCLSAINPGLIDPNYNHNGLFFGNPNQLVVQVLTVAVVAVFTFVGSYVQLRVIDRVTPLRVSPEEEEAGLHQSQHGEDAHSE